eukprot:360598-Chlamydomonas_euryale.AAC.3
MEGGRRGREGRREGAIEEGREGKAAGVWRPPLLTLAPEGCVAAVGATALVEAVRLGPIRWHLERHFFHLFFSWGKEAGTRLALRPTEDGAQS